MRRHALRVAVLALAVMGIHGTAGAQRPPGPIEEIVALDNDSIRIVRLTYHPGADSDIHLNVGPEITIVQQGDLALYTPKGREPLGSGGAHWLPAATGHLARNESQHPVTFWSLVLKRCE